MSFTKAKEGGWMAGLRYMLFTRAKMREDYLFMTESFSVPGEAFSMIPITS